MAVRIVRLGSTREAGEGPRIGTARRPPRGVKKTDWARRDYFDVWFPNLAPSAPLVSWALSEPWTDARWKKYERAYRAEMKKPEQQHLLALFAELSKHTDFSVGCYCEDEHRCHRSILRDLLVNAGAEVV